MRCHCKPLRISYKDYVTNEEVRAKIQQAIGPHEDLTIVKRRKLQWYGHVSRSTGLAKTILQGTVKGEEDKAVDIWQYTITVLQRNGFPRASLKETYHRETGKSDYCPRSFRKMPHRRATDTEPMDRILT